MRGPGQYFELAEFKWVVVGLVTVLTLMMLWLNSVAKHLSAPELIMGSLVGVYLTKTVMRLHLNISVLNKMPRDCTALNHQLMYSPVLLCCIPYNNMQALTKSTSVFDRLVDKHALTPEGKDWLISALDPFHDLDHPIAGYPDADSSSTVVGCYQYALDVAKDAAQTSATWDAHIMFNPVSAAAGSAQTYNAASVSSDGSYVTRDAGLATLGLGMVSVLKNNNGLSLFPAAAADIAATVTVNTIDVGGQIFAGNCRVIGAGLEVVDTTADIYKQGALTVYRLNQRRVEGCNVILWRDDSQATGKAAVAGDVRFQSPPSTVAQALLLPGSRQWDAKKGCYTVLTQSSVNNPISYPVSGTTTFTNQVVVSGASSFAMTTAFAPYSATVLPEVTFETNPRRMIIPFNSGGIMLTGLNANSTFRVKLKLYVESAPQYSQAGLSVLCTPSAPYDAAALEAYSKALAMLPVGVQAQYNALGDWFNTIAGIVSQIALPVSVALAPYFPAAPLIGAGVGIVAKGIQAATGQKKTDMTGSDMPDPLMKPKPPMRINLGPQKRPKMKKNRRI